jgi:predicted dehydrogenase
MSSTLRVAVVGTGGIGKAHLEAWKSVADARVVAVVDTDEARAKEVGESLGVAAFGSVAEMLSGVRPDAVDVCTPPSAHRAPAEAALTAGCHVLCEKPLAQNPTEARILLETARAGGILMTAFCHRFHPPVAALKALIDAGELGEVMMFRNRFAGPFGGVENTWFARPSVSGGGCLMDTSVHSVDLFRFLVGEVATAKGSGTSVIGALKGKAEDTAAMLLQAESGAVGVIEASWALQGGVNVVEVYGTKGVGFVHYWDGFESRYKTESMEDFAPLPEDGDRFVGELTHFTEAALGRTELAVTGHDGLRAVEVIYEAYASAGLEY